MKNLSLGWGLLTFLVGGLKMRMAVMALLLLSGVAVAKEDRFTLLNFGVGMEKDVALEDAVNVGFSATFSDAKATKFQRVTQTDVGPLYEGLAFYWNPTGRTVARVVYGWRPEGVNVYGQRFPKGYSPGDVYQQLSDKYGSALTFLDLNDLRQGAVRELFVQRKARCESDPKLREREPEECEKLSGEKGVSLFMAELKDQIDQIDEFRISCKVAVPLETVYSEPFCLGDLFNVERDYELEIEKGPQGQALINGVTFWLRPDSVLSQSIVGSGYFDHKTNDSEKAYLSLMIRDTQMLVEKSKMRSGGLAL